MAEAIPNPHRCCRDHNTGCCDNLPDTLAMEMTGDYTGSGALTWDEGASLFLGDLTATPTGDWPGGVFCVKLLCINESPGVYCWSIHMVAGCQCGFSSWGTGLGGNCDPDSGSCDPFLQTFSGVSSACEGDPIPPPFRAFDLVVTE